MNIEELIIFLVVGALAGWLAGFILKGRGFGVLANIIVGVIGAVVGGYVFGMLGVSVTGIVGSIIKATVGAVLLLFVIKVLKKV